MKQKPRILLAILFGSHATGRFGAMSDVDIAVLSDHELSFEERGQLIDEMAVRFDAPDDTIDLVDLWNAPPLLAYQIAGHGKLIAGTKFDFIRFKVLAWKRYQDSAKFRVLRANKLAELYGKGTH